MFIYSFYKPKPEQTYSPEILYFPVMGLKIKQSGIRVEENKILLLFGRSDYIWVRPLQNGGFHARPIRPEIAAKIEEGDSWVNVSPETFLTSSHSFVRKLVKKALNEGFVEAFGEPKPQFYFRRWDET